VTYHQACDTFANNNMHALDVNADAIAFSVLTYAYSTASVNGVAGKPVPGSFTIPAPAGPEARSPASSRLRAATQRRRPEYPLR
jgi:hypothetical protein